MKPLIIDELQPSYSLEKSAYFFEDQSGTVDFQTISAVDFDQWQANAEESLSFGYKDSVYWILVKLENPNSKDLVRLVEISYAVLDRIDVYIANGNGEITEFQFGDHIPYYRRPINHTNFLAPVDLLPNSTTNIFLRVETSSSIQIPLTLWKNTAILERDQDLLISSGIYFGVMMIMALYNLMLFFVLRDRNYLYYVFYVTSMASLLFGIGGYSFKYFWPNATTWNDQSLIVSLSCIVIFGLLFTRNFLQIPTSRPLIDKAIKFHILLGIICACLAFVLPYRFGILLSIFLGLSSIFLCMGTGLIRWKDRFHAVRYYVIAWFFLFIGGIIFALNKLGITPNNVVTQNAAQIGSGLEVMLLSIALANQMNTERRLREKAQQESLEASKEKEIAKSAAEAKSAFLATMSHEIRTPMNGVLGMVEMLRGTDLNMHQARYINTIYHSGQALLGVLNDILDYSKIESNKLEVEHVSVDLAEIIDECVSVFSNTSEEENVPLYIDYDPNIPSRIYSDPTRIRQILLNLISNSFKFTDTGYIHIQIDQLGNDTIQFSIKDTGIGLSEKEQSKLFQSFSQADNSTTRKYGGTGLGLAISKRLAELMGGTIGVSSKKGEGSTFWFTIKDHKLETPPALESHKDLTNHQLVIALSDDRFATSCRRYLNKHINNILAINGTQALEEHIQQTLNDKLQIFLIDDTTYDAIKPKRFFRKIRNRVLLLTAPSKALSYQGKVEDHLFLETPVSPQQVFKAMEFSLSPTNPLHELLDEALDIKGMNFLVAEDNTVNQMVIKGILKKHGAHAFIAENGELAVDKFRSHHTKIDAVLMDIEMPIMNGYEATEAIREFEQQQSLAKLPIFGLSAHALTEYMEKATEAGMDGFITKPITIKQLITHLQPLNQRKQAS